MKWVLVVGYSEEMFVNEVGRKEEEEEVAAVVVIVTVGVKTLLPKLLM